MPYISHALDEDLIALQELGTQLPEVGRQVRHIRTVYDRGRDKVSPCLACACAQSHEIRTNSLTVALCNCCFQRWQAQELVASLEWLNTPVPHRLRKIIFTPDAPVSGRWKAFIVRRLFSSPFLLTFHHSHRHTLPSCVGRAAITSCPAFLRSLTFCVYAVERTTR